MNEDEVKEAFGNDYKEPSISQELYDDSWERTIEIKLSRQGQQIIIVGVAAVGALVLVALQGKVVFSLMKTQAQIVEGLNGLNGVRPAPIQQEAKGRPTRVESSNDAVNEDAKPSSTVSYAAPSGKISTTAPAPDPTELDELRLLMNQATIETDLQTKSKEV